MKKTKGSKKDLATAYTTVVETAFEQTAEVLQLVNRLDFEPTQVVDAAAENPSLFLRAANIRIEQMRKRNQAKAAREERRAEVALHLRQDARETGERITESAIEQMLLVNPTIKPLSEALERAEEAEEYAKLLVEAFRMRRDCLKIISETAREEYNLQRAAEHGALKMREQRELLKKRYPGGAK